MEEDPGTTCECKCKAKGSEKGIEHPLESWSRMSLLHCWVSTKRDILYELKAFVFTRQNLTSTRSCLTRVTEPYWTHEVVYEE